MPTIRTITVDLTKLSGPATARWYDPSNGAYTTIAGSPYTNTGTRPFTPPGKNNDGDTDWVLVLNADTTAPIVTSITRLNPSPTNLASVDFTVTFSESVTGVATTDFDLTASGVSGAAVSIQRFGQCLYCNRQHRRGQRHDPPRRAH